MTQSSRRLPRLGLLFSLACSLVWSAAGPRVADAHPLSQGALEAVAHPDRVDVRARVTFEEVAITDMLTAAPGETEAAAAAGGADALGKAYARHAKYLAQHIQVWADGRPLAGRVVRVISPATAGSTQPAGTPPASIDSEHVTYELEYHPAAGETMTRPARVELRQDVLVGVEFAPGVTWEASYVVRIGTSNGAAEEGRLLTSTEAVVHECDWSASTETTPGAAGASPPPAARVDTWRLAKDFAYQGVHHILVGYDHLLFIGALVLAARTLWDLVKVVSAFTLAHTITLALSALDVVRLPDWVVEPMIAGSIVFVAAQNVLWPRQTAGWLRLGAAFFFGLFHGLGYAGGLLEAMEGMGGRTILLAILAFSVGVELGHQVIVLPVFGALHLARRAARDETARDRLSLGALRYGSTVICLAGLYYFVAAVSAGLSAATPAS